MTSRNVGPLGSEPAPWEEIAEAVGGIVAARHFEHSNPLAAAELARLVERTLLEVLRVRGLL